MSRIDQFSRIINHGITTAGQQFTVPTSNDHTDQTWLATDLYIGEIGVNITDDTIWMRTNNGIIQISASSSYSGASGSNIFVFNTPNIQISSTYSADSLSPRSGYYTDLGTSTYRWKDLYLGGATSGGSGINVNGSLILTEASSQGILTSGRQAVDNSPIIIYGTVSPSVAMSRPLMLNSKDVYMQGTGNQRVIIASNGVIMGTASDILVSGQNVVINSGISSHIHLGYGYNRTNYNSYEVVVGGALAVRGIADDGSTQYDKADWITTQDLLRTTTAATTNISTIPWGATNGCVMQVKAYLIGTNIADSTEVYSAEIMGVYNLDPTGVTASIVGNPIVNDVSTFNSAPPLCQMSADATNVYIKVQGTTTTIQWLVSYSYHQLINIV